MFTFPGKQCSYNMCGLQYKYILFSKLSHYQILNQISIYPPYSIFFDMQLPFHKLFLSKQKIITFLMTFCGLFKKLILGLIKNIDNRLLAKQIYRLLYSLKV